MRNARQGFGLAEGSLIEQSKLDSLLYLRRDDVYLSLRPSPWIQALVCAAREYDAGAD
jgi:hypothetical protein